MPLRAETTPVHKANYDLAAKWTAAKAARLTFDTSVAPHWLETGERFWYTYETRQGRRYWLVDCRAKTKKPLFDSARMAAMLTRITLTPYDAQHLPIRTLKFIKQDTAIRFEIDLSKDATVRVGDQFKTVQEIGDNAVKSDDMQDKSKTKGGDKQLQQQLDLKRDKTEQRTDKQLEQQQTDKQADKQQGKTDKQTDTKSDTKSDTKGTTKTDTQIVGKTKQDTDKQTDKQDVTRKEGQTTQAATTGEAASPTKTLFFEYDLKTEQVTLLPDFKAPPKKMLWASVSPDEKTSSLRARPQSVYNGRGKLRSGAKESRR